MHEYCQLHFYSELVKMFRQHLFFAALIVAFVNYSEAFPKGAGTGSCLTLTPVHRQNQPQTSAVPAQIVLDNSIVQPDQLLKITLRADPGTSFKGFVVQARRTDVDDTKESGNTLL